MRITVGMAFSVVDNPPDVNAFAQLYCSAVTLS